MKLGQSSHSTAKDAANAIASSTLQSTAAEEVAPPSCCCQRERWPSSQFVMANHCSTVGQPFDEHRLLRELTANFEDSIGQIHRNRHYQTLAELRHFLVDLQRD